GGIGRLAGGAAGRPEGTTGTREGIDRFHHPGGAAGGASRSTAGWATVADAWTTGSVGASGAAGFLIGSRTRPRGGTPRRRSRAAEVALDRPLRLRRAAGVEVQVVEVDVHHLHARLDAAEGERVARFDGFGVADRAFPVAMVQLRRPDEREEARRVDGVL